MHPEHLLTEEDMTLVSLYRVFRGGGMAAGPLPFAGGWAEQPAAVIAAFGEIAAADAVIERVKG